ncbi:discoidin domain-containing protein [Nonomuraea jabiensis]|uniref:discoidin domain-containing protein n=1 Tax=Nonomuraea jabiensis TaxID=882448 RepID=UPI00369909F9
MLGLFVMAPAPALAHDVPSDTLPTFVTMPGSKLAHPGVAHSAEQLARVRAHVRAGDQPWLSHYQQYTATPYASKSYVIANDANPDSSTLTPKYGYNNYNTGFFNNQMSSDARAAFDQAVLYYMTGDVDYRAKAMRIVRLWSLLDPSQAKPVVDAHIQQGLPMYMLNAAADLLRSTSSPDPSLAWTETDTRNYTTNFIEPPMRLYMRQNNYWFNQQQTAIMAAMSSFVFMDDPGGYTEQVEWFTVNSTVPEANAYANGSLSNALFDIDRDWTGQRLDHPQVVVKEMMRDQPHSSLNVQAMTIIARMMIAQGTKVDPKTGTVSTAQGAVGPYEFRDSRILKGANFWSRYNLGYVTPYNDGRNSELADFGRGRLYNFSEIYYHYRYVAGYADTDRDMRYLAEEFRRSPMPVDLSWLAIPDRAKGSPAPAVNSEPTGAGPYQVETRFTRLDAGAWISTEGDISFVRTRASKVGTRFAVTDFFNWRTKTLALRIRSDEQTTLELRRDAGTSPIMSIPLPDTDGQWRYVTLSLAGVPFGQFPGDIQIMYWSVTGSGVVDFDQMLASPADVTPPTFAGGMTRTSAVGWIGDELVLPLPATDTGAADTITYSLVTAPEGASIDAGGTVRWSPAKAGIHRLWVSATDGTVISLLELEITVAADYEGALAAASQGHDDAKTYTSDTEATYRAAKQAAVAATGTDRSPALADLRAAAARLQLLNPTLLDGTLDFAAIATSRVQVANLADRDLSTTTGDLWIADDKSFQLDFGARYRISPDKFMVAPRAMFSARTAGMVVFGSNDQVTWTRLTDAAIDSSALQTLPVLSAERDKHFRFLRFKDLDAGVLNRGQVIEDQPFSLGELRIAGGRSEAIDRLSAVSLSSSGTMRGRAASGDKVTLSFVATEAIAGVKVSLLGQDVTPIQGPDGKWTATATVTDDSKAGPAQFSIDYTTTGGNRADTAVFTTDDSAVLVSPSRDGLEVMANAAATVSSGSFTTGSAASLFDDNANTHTEFRLNGGGNGAWITFDFGKNDPNAKVQLSRAELLARANWANRIAGTFLQGSNDNTTWTTVSASAANTAIWQALSIKTELQDQAFRYIRVINGGGWYGNMAELRLFGRYGTGLGSEPPTYTVSVTTDTSDGGTVAVGVGDNASEGTTQLQATYGSFITAEATPKQGYAFRGWTQKKIVDGLPVEVNVSLWPKYNPGYFTGGYNGGTRISQLTENTELTAHFAKTVNGTTPAAPSGVEAMAGEGYADVRWTAPPSDGGESITGYLVTASPGVATCVTTGATRCRVEGLINGVSHTFRVTALNAAGYGVPSFPSHAVTPTDPASAGSTVVSVSAMSGRTGPHAWIRVRISNKEAAPVDVRVATVLGVRTVNGLKPGTGVVVDFPGERWLATSSALVAAHRTDAGDDTATVSQAGYQAVYPVER